MIIIMKKYGNNSAKIPFIDYRPIICNIYKFQENLVNRLDVYGVNKDF